MLIELENKKYRRVHYEHLSDYYKTFSVETSLFEAMSSYAKGNTIICNTVPFVYIFNPKFDYEDSNIDEFLYDNIGKHYITPKDIKYGKWRIVNEEKFKKWCDRK